MSKSLKILTLGLLATGGAAFAADPNLPKPGEIGSAVTPQEIARWDIDVRPDGLGLPPGQGTAEEGEQVWMDNCAACHGEFGEGVDRWPVLMGGVDSLTSDSPVKTPGSYWPYATTIYDYVYRAMPFGNAQSLTPDEVYALTAYILNMDEVVPSDFVVNAETLPKVEMPNRDGFIDDPRPDVKVASQEPCMKDCVKEVKITGHARKIDVTPEEGGGVE